jgi:hypothetical protein
VIILTAEVKAGARPLLRMFLLEDDFVGVRQVKIGASIGLSGGFISGLSIKIKHSFIFLGLFF